MDQGGSEGQITAPRVGGEHADRSRQGGGNSCFPKFWPFQTKMVLCTHYTAAVSAPGPHRRRRPAPDVPPHHHAAVPQRLVHHHVAQAEQPAAVGRGLRGLLRLEAQRAQNGLAEQRAVDVQKPPLDARGAAEALHAHGARQDALQAARDICARPLPGAANHLVPQARRAGIVLLAQRFLKLLLRPRKAPAELFFEAKRPFPQSDLSVDRVDEPVQLSLLELVPHRHSILVLLRVDEVRELHLEETNRVFPFNPLKVCPMNRKQTWKLSVHLFNRNLAIPLDHTIPRTGSFLIIFLL
mmetsp:Transcript_17618/g.48848  ORF Transcript_17618/g.48848 Transcript_17618/m.48848 type:complete len:297 (-) Transcript_17618:897-1787(-)